MKRIEFAELAGISPAMVTKYADQALIVFVEPNVIDARATLEALQGRLNEEKRRAALEKLDGAARIAANDAAPVAEQPAALRPGAKTAKAEIDELKRDTLQLELARKAGELVPVEDVERVILDAIAGLQAAFELEARAAASQLTIDLGLSPEREAMLSRRLRSLCNKARQRFAADMLTLAGGDLALEQTETSKAIDTAAPAV